MINLVDRDDTASKGMDMPSSTSVDASTSNSRSSSCPGQGDTVADVLSELGGHEIATSSQESVHRTQEPLIVLPPRDPSIQRNRTLDADTKVQAIVTLLCAN